jgi:predicted class III extradiol MEMO1 family dioxygenase
MSETQQPQPVFNPNAPHQLRPKLRPVRAFPAQVGEHQAMGLADARQISEKMVFTAPAAQFILPLMDGQKGLDEIVQQVGRGLTRPILEQLVAQLDDAGLIFGPQFDALLAKVRADFDSAPTLPPGASANFADMLVSQTLVERGKEQGLPENQLAEATEEEKAALSQARLREVFDQFIDKSLEAAQNPSLDALPKAIVAPHLDYGRGWMNYGAAWGRLRVVDRPDRVIVLGTNHFGEATGVCGCDKGYQTPLGTCEVDGDVLIGLKKHLGAEQAAKLFANRYDHEREHSIELQIAWIQHVLGKDEAGNYCKVFGALIHDPAVNSGESYDGNGLGLDPFVEALRKTLAELPGKTLVVASADLSHVGPMFGDKQPLHIEGESEDAKKAEAFRNQVFQHDREMLGHVVQNQPDNLVAAMAWQQNPTRWCSTGNLVATLKLVQPTKIDILNYAAALDPQSSSMVSSVAIAMS